MFINRVHIDGYKNLKNFNMVFKDKVKIDLLIGINGSGKSNFIEAILEIFKSLITRTISSFEYEIEYRIGDKKISVCFKDGILSKNNRRCKYITSSSLPKNILIYYSGHNKKISYLIDEYWVEKRKTFTDKTPLLVSLGYEHRVILILLGFLTDGENFKAIVSNNLKIDFTGQDVKFIFKKPIKANKLSAWNNENPKLWSVRSYLQDWFNKLYRIKSSPEGISDEGYFSERNEYILYCKIIDLKSLIGREGLFKFFKFLYELKSIEVLNEIDFKLTHKDGTYFNVHGFSDGEAQTLYYQSIIDLFGNEESLLLMDEPDAFLHPEWQLGFIKTFSDRDLFDISSHVIINSHSASTISECVDGHINMFSVDANVASCKKIDKGKAIKKLTSGLMVYERHAHILNILERIQYNGKPILFTEGITDPVIINTAWDMLYDEPIPFTPFSAFNRTFLRHILKDEKIYKEYNKPFFGLFDFDEAYHDWNALGAQEDGLEESDPLKGLCKRVEIGKNFVNGYGFLLPVPENEIIQKQVIKDPTAKSTYEYKSVLTIELLFFGCGNYYSEENAPGGKIIEFKGNKVSFAEKVVPSLGAEHFKVFLPMFEFIKAKCES